jgi:S-adenosylmethionine-diacylgycerolhomoserine-N-methlytransferase
MNTAAALDDKARMDAIYRYQRLVYDVTRRYYLLGRDRLLADLAAPPGSAILEIGCGTGRNLIKAARLYPEASLFGLDLSSVMLATAGSKIARAGLDRRITLGEGDATAFDAVALFERPHFDRVVLSYTLSMIPAWQAALRAALLSVAPGGRLHLVDFGRQDRHPAWARRGLRSWLSLFSVEPRDTLADELRSEAGSAFTVTLEEPIGGYYVYAVATRR